VTHPFIAARDFLLAHRMDYETAVRGFRWPSMHTFNWALDYFDTFVTGNTRPALIVAAEDEAPEIRTFHDIAEGSARVHAAGARRRPRSHRARRSRARRRCREPECEVCLNRIGEDTDRGWGRRSGRMAQSCRGLDGERLFRSGW
jgi:hypothetical protein